MKNLNAFLLIVLLSLLQSSVVAVSLKNFAALSLVVILAMAVVFEHGVSIIWPFLYGLLLDLVTGRIMGLSVLVLLLTFVLFSAISSIFDKGGAVGKYLIALLSFIFGGLIEKGLLLLAYGTMLNLESLMVYYLIGILMFPLIILTLWLMRPILPFNAKL